MSTTSTPSSTTALNAANPATLKEVGDDLQAAFTVALNIHSQTLENLRCDALRAQFKAAATHFIEARSTVVFGIGP